ncbi:MAG: extracellular solute-binding protein [Chloroflexi bacterium]|nr:MAG: extracellular solute-binding protein [Chloroflexota bacterium]
MSKRLIVRWFLVIAVLVLSGCSSAAPAAPAAGEKVTIRLWSHQNSAFNKVNQELIDGFMKENPDITVKYETFPYDQFIETLQTSMPAGTEADVIEMFGSWVCNYADGARLADMPADVMSYKEAQEVFYQAPLDGYYCNGNLYGLPNEFNLEYGGALVSPALYEKAGIPFPPAYTDYNTLISDAKKMTVLDGDTMTTAGFHFVGGDTLGFLLLSGILEQGGTYFAEDGKHFNFESPESLNVIRTLTRYAQEDKVIDATLFSGDNGLPNAFFNGNVGIGYIGSWAAGVGKVDFPDFKFDYVMLPPMFGTEPKFVADAGWGKVVSKNTKHSEASWKLVKYMTAERANALKFNQISGTIPAMKSIVEQPDEILAVQPWIKPTFALLKHGAYLGNVTDRDQLFYEIIAKNLTDALTGAVTPEQAAAAIQKQANEMVDSKSK